MLTIDNVEKECRKGNSVILFRQNEAKVNHSTLTIDKVVVRH